jgi:TRAP-type C4-dicarboxylate transport system permease small subunit
MYESLYEHLPPRIRRLMRRRANRFERGLPMSLTTPVPPEAVSTPLPPSEVEALSPRPPAATLAAVLLAALGIALAAGAVLDMGVGVLDVLGEPAVDGMTQLVLWLVAAFLGALVLALLGVAALHGYASWRIWHGVNWGWIEGLAVSVIGLLFSGTMFGLTDDGQPTLSLGLLLALVGYAGVVGGILAARTWFPPVRFPMDPSRGPWWLRLRRGPRW